MQEGQNRSIHPNTFAVELIKTQEYERETRDMTDERQSYKKLATTTLNLKIKRDKIPFR